MQKPAEEGSVPPLGLVRAFAVQWWTAGIVFFYLGLKTVYQALERGSGHNPHLVLVGSVEALAAILFLIPRSLRIGAVALLLVYAGAVSFVAVHGPVPVSWLRAGRTDP